MKKIKIILPVLILAGLIGLSVWYIQQRSGANNKHIKVSGNIEATDIRLAFRVPGKILELLTDEGKTLTTGDVVARLDTDELVKIKNEAEASLKAAEFAYQRADEDYGRLENLFKAGAISAQKRDTARTAADSSKAQVEALRASLELAVTRLGFAELLSPITGYVLTKSAEAGEVIPAGATVFTVADLKNIWVTAYINEKDIGRVKLDQEADIRIDTYPDKIYKGRVSFIAQESEFTPKQIQTTEERVKLVYRIKIMVDNSRLELKPGMPADAYIYAD